VLFLVAFDAMIVFGALLVPSRQLAGIGLIAFGLLVEAALLLQALKPGWQYAVGPEGIEVKRTLGSRTFARGEISSVEAVDGARIRELLAEEQWSEVGAGRSMDVGAGLRARSAISGMVAFSSVPIILSQTKRGGPLAVKSVGAGAPGAFVLLTLSAGTRHALSPMDVDGFVAAFKGAKSPGS
jgi:hypothetical protein